MLQNTLTTFILSIGHSTRVPLPLLLMLCYIVSTTAQTSNNPFELSTSRENDTALYKQQSIGFSLGQLDTATAGILQNPFEIRIIKKPSPPQQPSEIKKKADLPQIFGQSNPIGSKTLRSFLFWILTALFVYLAINLTLFRYFLLRLYKAFINDNFLRLLHRELKGGVVYPYWTFYFFSLLNFGLFLFLLLKHVNLWQHFSDTRILLYCIGGTLFIFFGKQSLLRIISLIFPFQQILEIQSFSITVFSSMLGLALFPLNTFIAFSSESISVSSLYLAIVLIGIVYLFRYLRSIFSASRIIIQYRFHFFVYLCTIELAPVLILVRILYDLAGV